MQETPKYLSIQFKKETRLAEYYTKNLLFNFTSLRLTSFKKTEWIRRDETEFQKRMSDVLMFN